MPASRAGAASPAGEAAATRPPAAASALAPNQEPSAEEVLQEINGRRANAGRLLTDRLAWLAVVTVAVILAAGQLLVVTRSYRSLGRALHDAAFTTTTGEPLRADDTFAQLLELFLAAYSVAVFGTLAGAVGAFVLSRERAEDERRQPDE